MTDILYPLKELGPGIYEVMNRRYKMQDAFETLSKDGDCVKMRAWVKIGGEFFRKTIIRSFEDPYTLLYITQDSLDNDEKVIDIREASALVPEEGLVSEFARRIGHNYAVLWVTRKARYWKLERDWPELDWFFEGIREDEDMAGAYARPDDDMSSLIP